MARAIDADRLLQELMKMEVLTLDRKDLFTGPARIAVFGMIGEQPTLTPPNEAPPCYQPDGDGCAYQCYDGQDDPIEKCKACPLCYSDKQRHYTTPNEWVSVDERLPEPGERVLATDCGFVGEFYINKCGKWQRYNVNCFELLMALDILYWMPLPAPPNCRQQEGEA